MSMYHVTSLLSGRRDARRSSQAHRARTFSTAFAMWGTSLHFSPVCCLYTSSCAAGEFGSGLSMWSKGNAPTCRRMQCVLSTRILNRLRPGSRNLEPRVYNEFDRHQFMCSTRVVLRCQAAAQIVRPAKPVQAGSGVMSDPHAPA